VAGVYKIDEKAIALYFEGSLIARVLVPTIFAGTAAFSVAAMTYSSYPYYFHGHLDELRLTKGVARYDISLASLYNLPTEAFADS
jgi:hypothetical protein